MPNVERHLAVIELGDDALVVPGREAELGRGRERDLGAVGQLEHLTGAGALERGAFDRRRPRRSKPEEDRDHERERGGEQGHARPARRTAARVEAPRDAGPLTLDALGRERRLEDRAVAELAFAHDRLPNARSRVSAAGSAV